MDNEPAESEAQSSVITGLTEITNKACRICGLEDDNKLLLTCIACNNVKQHANCANLPSDTAPDSWKCEQCPSSQNVPNPYEDVIEPDTENAIDPTDLPINFVSFTIEYSSSSSDGSCEIYSAIRTPSGGYTRGGLLRPSTPPRVGSPGGSGDDTAGSPYKKPKLDHPGSSSK